MIIRKAIKEDCPRIMELIRELAIFENAENEVEVSLEHFIQSGFGEKPVWWAYVAETNSDEINLEPKIIGFALYYIRYSTWKGQRLYLEDLLVTKDARGTGAGKALLNEVIIEAKRLNLSGLNWQVLDWNEKAIEFYKKYKVQLDDEWINCSLHLTK